MQLLQNYSIFPFILSVCVFLLFKSINIKARKACAIIATLSSCSFYVYIVQEHDAVRMWFWQLISLPEYADTMLLIPVVFAWALVLWLPALCFYWITKITDPLADKIYALSQKAVGHLVIGKGQPNSEK